MAYLKWARTAPAQPYHKRLWITRYFGTRKRGVCGLHILGRVQVWGIETDILVCGTLQSPRTYTERQCDNRIYEVCGNAESANLYSITDSKLSKRDFSNWYTVRGKHLKCVRPVVRHNQIIHACALTDILEHKNAECADYVNLNSRTESKLRIEIDVLIAVSDETVSAQPSWTSEH